MKKVYFMAFIATAALTMMSCSNDDITTGADFSKNEATAINFSTYLGRNVESRAGETTSTSIQTSGFGVFASYTGISDFVASVDNDITVASIPNFMYNQKVTYTADAWTYSPVKYWPNAKDEKVSFFAYAPYSDNSDKETNNNIKFKAVDKMSGTPQLEVTVPEDLTKSVDFVAAAVLNQTKPTDPATTPVKYELQHEMTRLSMQAKVSEDVYKTSGTHNKTFVVIKSIKFNSPNESSQIYKSGTYTFSTTSTKDTGSDVKRGSWSNRKGGNSFDFSTILKTSKVTASTAVTGTKYKTGETGIKLTDKTAVSLFKDNQYAYFIPVADGLSTSQKETVTIAYDVVTEDESLKDGYTCASATKTIELPSGILQVGKSYTLTFVIGVNEVMLTAEAAGWGTDASTTDVKVPASGSDATAE